MLHYHNIKALEDLEKALKVSETLEKIEESKPKATNDTAQQKQRQESKSNNNVRKEITKGKQTVLYKWLKP